MAAKSNNEYERLLLAHLQTSTTTAAGASGGIDATEALAFFDDLDLFAELATEPRPAASVEASVNLMHRHANAAARPAAPFASFRAQLGLDVAPFGDMLDANELDAMQLLFETSEPMPTITNTSNDKTVTAIHSFTQEREMLPSTFASSSSSSISNPSAVAPVVETPPAARGRQPTRKKQTKKISSTQRLKEELSYLRSRVSALDTELTLLTDQRGRATGSPCDSMEDCSSAVKSDAGADEAASERAHWEALAKRQREAKSRAETENAVLRQRLQDQLKFARSLERMLRKRRVWDGLHEPTKQRFASLSLQDSEILEAITTSVNARIHTVDDVFAAQGLTPRSAPRHEACITVGADDALRIEFVHSAVAPFAMHAVSNVVWRHLQKQELMMNGMKLTLRIVEQTDDFLLAKQCVTLGESCCTRTVYFACRRVVQAHRVVIVWETFSASAASAVRGFPAMQLTSQGYGSITGNTTVQREHQLSDSESSLLQSCAYVTPTMPSDGSDGDASEPEPLRLLEPRHGLFTELMISTYEENAQTVRQLIENALLDDLMAKANNV